jgi:hypothetical protein
MGLSLQHLLWYADEAEDMLKRIVTASLPTRMRAYFSLMETFQFTLIQKFGYAISWEGYAYCFLGFLGSTLDHFLKHGANVNSASYCEVLSKLQDAIHRKHPG